LRYAVRYAPVATLAAAVTTLVVIVSLRPTRVSPAVSSPFVATVFFGLVVSAPALFRHLAGLLRRVPDDELARVTDGLALALLLLGVFTFVHALVPVLTGVAFWHPFRDLRIAAVLLTVVGYALCSLTSAVILHRSHRAFSKSATAARESATET
jgi:hypothetical protein